MKTIVTAIRWLFRGEVPLSRLTNMGLTVGAQFNRQIGCVIDPSHCWLITIGNNVTLAPKVHILAHDASTKQDLGYTVIGKVEIGNNVFVGAGTIILPNTVIGDGVIIGAGSIVKGQYPSGVVVAGNPAKIIANRDQFLDRHREMMKSRPLFDETYTIGMNISKERQREMRAALQDGVGYVT